MFIRRILEPRGRRWWFLHTSTSTPSPDSNRIWPTRVSWSASCAAAAVRSRVSSSPRPPAPVSTSRSHRLYWLLEPPVKVVTPPFFHYARLQRFCLFTFYIFSIYSKWLTVITEQGPLTGAQHRHLVVVECEPMTFWSITSNLTTKHHGLGLYFVILFLTYKLLYYYCYYYLLQACVCS